MTSRKRSFREIESDDVDNSSPPHKKQRLENNEPKFDLSHNESKWNVINKTKYVVDPSNGIYSEFMSATRTANYLLDDPLLDWLNLYYCQHGFNNKTLLQKEEVDIKKEYDKNSKYMNIYFDGGIKFEDLVMKSLEKKWGKDIITINTTGREGTNKENFNKTIRAMKKGIPFIAQAVLYNTNNNTRGNADLIVRSDYMNKLVLDHVLSAEEETFKAPKLNGNYHYLVIDIKWSTLNLCAKDNTLRKCGRIPAYKGQLAIYNCALGNIQGYTPTKSYLMGKGWRRDKIINKEKFPFRGNDCFECLGIVDYAGIDNMYIEKTAKAIQWYQDVVNNGKKWSPFDPPNENMYPNMSNDDMVWGSVKKKISDKIGEITQICNVGIKERTALHQKGIYSYYDSHCNTPNMGLKNTETANKIDTVLDILRDDQYNIFPRKIQNNMKNWQEASPVDFYFDFETISELLTKMTINIHNSSNISGMIFEIGIGWIEKGEWKFEKFYIDQIDEQEEGRMIDNFYQFILKKSLKLDPQQKYYPRLFHWTNAECNNLKDANKRHGGKWNDLINEINVKFVDMYKVFIGSQIDGMQYDPIGIKGALNYKLKTIGKALYNLKKIDTQWPDNDISNGQIAMLEAARYYRNKKNNKLSMEDIQVFDDIIKYNEIDCKMIWEIVNYFRRKHSDLDLD